MLRQILNIGLSMARTPGSPRALSKEDIREIARENAALLAAKADAANTLTPTIEDFVAGFSATMMRNPAMRNLVIARGLDCSIEDVGELSLLQMFNALAQITNLTFEKYSSEADQFEIGQIVRAEIMHKSKALQPVASEARH